MRNCELVIFDLDGTLLDTSEGIKKSVGYVIDSLNLPKITDDVLRTFIGPPMQRSFERVFGMNSDDAMKAADMFRDRYKDGDVLLARPYDGIFETIEELERAGIKTAVATYKRQDYADIILEHFGFDRAVDAICGSDFEGKLSKKDIIKNAIDVLGVSDISRAVMVGDSDNDAQGAAELGIAFIGVTYGFGFAGKADVDAFPNIGCASSCKEITGCVI
ncbi:MAG: HAD hydrolase-like protein [Lachnospiraceae bacterium]|nr:HAD hydrolase-like protein [Lachnospiraceae bacterium]MBR4573966.1 HAD hydrolase-like protein [Lachnospiraceae bacterium]